MNIADSSVINQFMDTFTRYIDSGFGLLSGDVIHLTGILIVLDVTLAGLMWAMDSNGNAIHILPLIAKPVVPTNTSGVLTG